MQAVMAAAKQQHQQHIADIESHLQEATEATQHAQASEAEVKLTAESLGKAVKADQAASKAAAKQTEAALQQLKDTLAASTQQHTETLRGFILSTVHSAVRQATAGWQDVSGTARDARGLLEEVSNEIHTSMQTASQLLEERLRCVEAAIASGSQTERACAGPTSLGHNQVTIQPLFHPPTAICNSILLQPCHTKSLSNSIILLQHMTVESC